ncbi:unnamed protein product [Durusdinium trenchii]
MISSARLNFRVLRVPYALWSCRPHFFKAASTKVDKEKMQRRFERLVSLLRRVERPHLESFECFGTMHTLPLRAKDAKIEECSDETLAYFSGFFDGDGCVTMASKSGRIRLTVGQSVRGADILVRLRSAFGGGICRHSDGCGLQRPRLQWWVAGKASKRAAALLAKNSYMKQAQLQIASHGDVVTEERIQVAQQMEDLKARNHVPENFAHMSWPYFAGFF